MPSQLTISAVFIAGFLSFLSPCFLPLLPSFITYISGVKIKEIDKKPKLLLHCLAFVIGFSVVFIIIGGTIGYLGQIFITNQNLLQKIGGAFIILLGLYMLGYKKIPWLNRDYKLSLPKSFQKLNYARSFLIGFFFAFGWSPCYGPIIGAILTLVASQSSFKLGLLYFAIYSVGFSIPFILSTLVIDKFLNFKSHFDKFYKYSSYLTGILLILLGLLIMSSEIDTVIAWLYQLAQPIIPSNL